MTKKQITALRARAFALLDWFSSANKAPKLFHTFDDSMIVFFDVGKAGEYPGIRCYIDGGVLFRGHDVSRWPDVVAICERYPIEVEQ
jgi:hypothetical protein